MDRNIDMCVSSMLDKDVATREGGVDRNKRENELCDKHAGSPPARVAWIETHRFRQELHVLRKSPPARVAWIETYKWEYADAVLNRRHPRGWRG